MDDYKDAKAAKRADVQETIIGGHRYRLAEIPLGPAIIVRQSLPII